ncbi:Uncharacterised protein [Pseudomonas putida]|uniref:hypothetical protein n=1 Tax=Pseudomonas guariconensis TaxID=1288410 RepID=UPI001FA64CC6|nr:hypothetical protein [Pseudomonas guariconensis]CAB5583198.1 Uncharacterised protein [Pseudomonas putida]MDM9594666.1 hypothetical protein [Pseudomonas guariconensis]MDM9607496.1 hypothetical protein [Pseudomonas guariconensis]CAB5585863.1 Uncharacterised protein [Pseudomonas putida]CAB5627366.1 Uncharacterised protein [Pseudomonas putida]
MSDKAEYYQMKGMVSEMTPEEQAEVLKAEADVIAIAKQSEKALIGALMAMIKLSLEA